MYLPQASRLTNSETRRWSLPQLRVQVADNCGIIVHIAAIPRDCSPGKGAELVGGSFDRIYTGDGLNFGIGAPEFGDK